MILQRLAKYDFHEMTFVRWFMQKTDNRALSSKYCRTLSYVMQETISILVKLFQVVWKLEYISYTKWPCPKSAREKVPLFP